MKKTAFTLFMISYLSLLNCQERKCNLLKKNELSINLPHNNILIGDTMGIFRNLLTNCTKRFASIKPQYVKIVPSNEVNGQLKLQGGDERVEVKEPTKVNGDCTASNALFHEALEINGTANLIGCVFQNVVLIRGTPHLVDSTFEKALEIIANRISFRACHANEVYLTNPLTKGFLLASGRPKVKLKNSSVELISFDRPGGVVYCDRNSSVNKVNNGTIKKI